MKTADGSYLFRSGGAFVELWPSGAISCYDPASGKSLDTKDAAECVRWLDSLNPNVKVTESANRAADMVNQLIGQRIKDCPSEFSKVINDNFWDLLSK